MEGGRTLSTERGVLITINASALGLGVVAGEGDRDVESPPLGADIYSPWSFARCQGWSTARHQARAQTSPLPYYVSHLLPLVINPQPIAEVNASDKAITCELIDTLLHAVNPSAASRTTTWSDAAA